MADMKKILAGAQKNWDKAKKRVKTDPGGFQEYEDGRYTARLVSAKLGQSESSQRNQITFGWKFEDGEYEGKIKNNYQGIDSEDNLYFLGRDLERLGYEVPDDLTDLPDILEDIEKTKPLAMITLKTKGDFQNLYIRKVLADDEEEEETEEEETDTEDEASEDADETEETDEDVEGNDEGGDEEEEEEGEETEEEEEGEEDEGDEVDLTVGMRVQAETAKGREGGEIVALLPDEEKIRVKLDSGKVIRISPDRIELEEAEEEEEEKPAKKNVARKSDSAPAKKTVAPAKKPAPAPVKKTGPAKKAASPAKKKTKK